MLETMLVKIARRHGAQRIGFETARESYVTAGQGAVHYKGLFEQISDDYSLLPQLPEEKEPLDQNIFDGTRHNQAFVISELLRTTALLPRNEICMDPGCWHATHGKIGQGTYLFAADPLFWNWNDFGDKFGYFTSREPGMASTLVEHALWSSVDAPVVAIYGSLHFKGIEEQINQSGRQDELLLKKLAFIRGVGLYNPSLAPNLEESNAREVYQIDNVILKPDANIIVSKQGPTTAQEALRLANYADQAVGD
jgi:hypothetical protein